MIEHLVLFNLKPEVDADKVEWMLRETRIRLLKIPVVRGLRCGSRIAAGPDWSMFLLAELDSVEKLGCYRDDPVQVRFFDEVIKPNATDWIALDYQSDPAWDPLLG